jgi:ssDNA-binding Zn-finger/Zn-ribbon topoisomerase 1
MLVKRTNRSTQQQFLGCEKYPNCKHTESLPKTTEPKKTEDKA